MHLFSHIHHNFEALILTELYLEICGITNNKTDFAKLKILANLSTTYVIYQQVSTHICTSGYSDSVDYIGFCCRGG